MWQIRYVDSATGSPVCRWLTSQATLDRIIADLTAAGVTHTVVSLSDLPGVDVSPAFVWDCLECGERQFGEFTAAPLNSDDVAAIREIVDIPLGDSLEGGDYATVPDWVRCQRCGESYRPRPGLGFSPEIGGDDDGE